MEKTISQIIGWIKNYTQQARVKSLVIDISGGVDSAVVSTLCARAGSPVLYLEMPIHQAESHINRAEEHISFLRAHYPSVTDLQVDLTPVFDQFVAQVPLTDKPTYEMALADTRARLRMAALYYFAGLEGYIVVDTNNKIEDFDVDFLTKHGDRGVDISPIAGLMKSGVYKLGEYLQTPQSILKAKPSNGLFGGDRGDGDQLKATYGELEWAMLQTERKQTVEAFTGRQREVFEIYTRLNRANQHRMQPTPTYKVNK